MAWTLQNRLSKVLLSNSSSSNLYRQVQRSQLHTISSVSQRFSALLGLFSNKYEKKARRRDDCPTTKNRNIKQDATLLAACRLPYKLIRDELPQGPWHPQRAPEHPPKCWPASIEKAECPTEYVSDCEKIPAGELSCPPTKHNVLKKPFFFSNGKMINSPQSFSSRDFSVSSLQSCKRLDKSSGKSSKKGGKGRKKAKKNSLKELKELKGKEICTQKSQNKAVEKSFGGEKKAADKTCEPDISWKNQTCSGRKLGHDTCGQGKCAKRKATGKEESRDQKGHSSTSTKSTDRSYSTLSNVELQLLKREEKPESSLRWIKTAAILKENCCSGNSSKNEEAKKICELKKKERKEVEDCGTVTKCGDKYWKLNKTIKESEKGKAKK